MELTPDAPPSPGPGQVLVRLRACGVCTFERRLYSGATPAYPIVPGHESAGTIQAVGPGADPDLRPGDHVVLALIHRCFRCDACRRGRTSLCRNRRRGRTPGALRRVGGFARYAVVPDWQVFQVSPELPFARLTLVEPLACVIHSVHRAALRFGDRVAVLGGGTMGQLHAALSRLRGAHVVLTEPDPAKRAVSQAHVNLDPGDTDALQALHGAFDAVFVTHGALETAVQAQRLVRDGGRVVLYGSFPKGTTLPIDPNRVHRAEVVYDGASNQDLGDWQEAVRLLEYDLIDVDDLISARFPLERIHDAMQHAVTGVGFRTVVLP